MAAIVLIVVAALLAVREGLWFMRSATVLSRANPTPLVVRIFLKLRRAGVARSDTSIQAGNHSIPVRIYAPLHVANPPVIVLVHGFAPEGNQDDYLDYVATRMALVGFEAVVPTITSEQYLQSRTDGMRDIGETVKWSSQRAHARVSLFGVSFGGGLAVATAEDPAYAGYLRMVFDLSGYDSLQRLGHYYIHDKVTGPYGVPYPSDPPMSGTALVALQDLDKLVPPDQVAPMRKAMLVLFNSRAHPDWARAEAALDADQRQTLEHLLDVSSPAVHDRYVNLIEAHNTEDKEISPDGKFGQLRCSLYVLHGSHDHTIPEGEAEWARAEIPSGTQAHFLITPGMDHAGPTAKADTWQKLEIAFFMADALASARESPPPGASVERRGLAWFEASR